MTDDELVNQSISFAKEMIEAGYGEEALLIADAIEQYLED